VLLGRSELNSVVCARLEVSFGDDFEDFWNVTPCVSAGLYADFKRRQK
jgi:hypothetical protein